MATTPAVVSAALRKGGVRPLPSGTPVTRDGVRVTGSGVTGTVHVTIDYLASSHRGAVTNAAREVLTAAGYVVTDVHHDAAAHHTSFNVTKGA